jgi:Phage capsid family
MSTDVENLTADFGLMKREFRDARSVLSRLGHQTRKLFEPRLRARPGGLTARFAVCELFARTERRKPADVARQHFADDRDLARLIELKGAVAPAQTTVAGWAAELAAVVVQDIADNLLPASVLTQLRAQGLAYGFIDGAVARVPVHTPTPSGGFVLEAGAIPVGALILTALNLKPKKAASITAITRELVNGSPLNVELSLRVLLGEDLGLAIDGILLGNAAASAAQPAGLLNGLTPIVPSAATTPLEKIAADIKALVTAIAPATRPVLLMNTVQATSVSLFAPGSIAAVISSPRVAAGTVIAVDAAAFASALGVPDFATDENPVLHMDTAPSQIGTAGTPNVVAAPTQSLWQTACIGLRTLIDCDWTLRRASAVAVITGVAW